MLKIQEAEQVKRQDIADEETFVIVTQVGQSCFGIIVDKVSDTEEIVVKPVSPVLRNISVFSRSEEHTSELQSLMRISYAVFCLQKKTKHSTQLSNNSNT